jgi:hypothetical protein
MRTLSIDLPLPPRELSPNGRPTPRQKMRIKTGYQEHVIVAVRALGPFDPEAPLFGAVRLRYDVLWCGKAPDRTNIIGSLKSAEDILVSEGVLTDDGPEYVLGHEVTYERVAKRKDSGVRITVEEVEGKSEG